MPYRKLKGSKIGQLNITSLVKHIEELRIFLHDHTFDILCINETRLDDTIHNDEVKIIGYELVRKDRNRNGGGVAIFIRNAIPYIERRELIPDNVEAICLEIKKSKSKPVLISTWYRPPDSSIDLLDRFEKFLQKADDEQKELIITGDLNCNLLAMEGNAHTIKLTDLFDVYQLQQHIKSPTRVTNKTSTLLDLILTKIDDLKTIDSGVIHLGISDHSLVYICRKISIPREKPKIVETRQFKNFNITQFQHDLREALNTLHDSYTDPNTAFHDWKEIFLEIADFHAPIRRKKVKSEYNPWLTNEIKSMSYRRDYLKKKAVSLNSTPFYESYKRCRNQVNRLIKEVKANYYKSKLENCKNSKESWKTINELLNKQSKCTTITEVIVNCNKVSGDKNIADEFNNFFTTIGPQLAENISPNDLDPLYCVAPESKVFEFRNISYVDVERVINKTNASKSPGLDKISNKLLKSAGNAIIDSLVYIFNLSINNGIFPEEMKLAKVTPIYKSGEKTDCDNYRPISVISAVAKIFEKIIYIQFNDYLNNNQIISKHQSGFRTQHSTETTLLHTTNQCLVNMDKGLINGILFLDLKKAFDTVDHKILVSKLERYGVRGVTLKWFQSYLHERKQICKINSSKSNTNNITCGVPQGSNLGPLLFLVYINDLPNCLETTQASMFADDTNITCRGESPADIESKINIDLDNVHNWLTANKLTLNREKTEYMIVGSRQRLKKMSNNTHIQIVIGDQTIEQVHKKKVLGVIIDDQLRWQEHNDAQCKKISKNIALLRRAKNFVTQDALLTMYNSLVLPHFTYCSTVWNNGNNVSQVNKLYKLQKRAARVITGSGYEIRSSEIFDKLKWDSIETIFKKREQLMIFKALRGMTPTYLSELFETSHNNTYRLRSNDRKLYLNKPKTNFLKHSFSYRGARSWNSLPQEIVDKYEYFSINSFKKCIDEHYNDLQSNLSAV